MYQRILVPIDGSNASSKGLDTAIDMARLTGGSLRLFHVIDELVFSTGFEPGATYMNDVLPRIRADGARVLEQGLARAKAAGVVADTALSECFARRTADVVLEAAQAWKADLIVIGTHGRRGVNRFLLGSDAEQIVRGASVPVLVARNVDVEASTAARTPAAAPPRVASATV